MVIWDVGLGHKERKLEFDLEILNLRVVSGKIYTIFSTHRDIQIIAPA